MSCHIVCLNRAAVFGKYLKRAFNKTIPLRQSHRHFLFARARPTKYWLHFIKLFWWVNNEIVVDTLMWVKFIFRTMCVLCQFTFIAQAVDGIRDRIWWEMGIRLRMRLMIIFDWPLEFYALQFVGHLWGFLVSSYTYKYMLCYNAFRNNFNLYTICGLQKLLQSYIYVLIYNVESNKRTGL